MKKIIPKKINKIKKIKIMKMKKMKMTKKKKIKAYQKTSKQDIWAQKTQWLGK